MQLVLFFVLLYALIASSVAADFPEQLGVSQERLSDQKAAPSPAELPGRKSGAGFVIREVNFRGNTLFSDAELAEVASRYLSRHIEMADLEALRIELTRYYTDRGYVNSGAILPSQHVNNGILYFQIIEGKVGKVHISVGNVPSVELITKKLKADVESEILNVIKLQEMVQVLIADSLVSHIDMNLVPTSNPALAHVNIAMEVAERYQFSVTSNNHSSPGIGENQLKISSLIRNATGYGDQLHFDLALNRESRAIAADYSIPINRHGTNLKLLGRSTVSGHISEAVQSLDIESKTREYGLEVFHPIKKASAYSLGVGAGFLHKTGKNSISAIPFSFSSGEVDGLSKLSVASVWQEYRKQLTSGNLLARTSLAFGTGLLGSTRHSDSRPDGRYLLADFQLHYLHRLKKNSSSVLLKAGGQLASDSLLPLARYSLGGSSNVRGYVENAIVKDQGVFLSLEWRSPVLASPNFGNFTFIPFVDYGIGSNRNADMERLSSVGVGLLWRKRDRYCGELFLGYPLSDLQQAESSGLQRKGIHFSIRADFE